MRKGYEVNGFKGYEKTIKGKHIRTKKEKKIKWKGKEAKKGTRIKRKEAK